MEKSFALGIGKNDTGSCSILSPWKNWLRCHWKKNNIGLYSMLNAKGKNPPDIDKTATRLSSQIRRLGNFFDLSTA
jgi:hypothetical protein